MQYSEPYPATTYGHCARNRWCKIHIWCAAVGKALAKAIFPGAGDFGHFERPELVFFRTEVGRGFHRIVPRDFLAAVAGFAAEDAGHGAFGDVLGFIERLAITDTR